jgi:hypothetical protein
MWKCTYREDGQGDANWIVADAGSSLWTERLIERGVEQELLPPTPEVVGTFLDIFSSNSHLLNPT